MYYISQFCLFSCIISLDVILPFNFKLSMLKPLPQIFTLLTSSNLICDLITLVQGHLTHHSRVEIQQPHPALSSHTHTNPSSPSSSHQLTPGRDSELLPQPELISLLITRLEVCAFLLSYHLYYHKDVLFYTRRNPNAETTTFTPVVEAVQNAFV